MTPFASRIAGEVTSTLNLLTDAETEMLANGNKVPQALDLVAQRLTDIAAALAACRITPPADLNKALRLEAMRAALSGTNTASGRHIEIF